MKRKTFRLGALAEDHEFRALALITVTNRVHQIFKVYWYRDTDHTLRINTHLADKSG